MDRLKTGFMLCEKHKRVKENEKKRVNQIGGKPA